ncbi:hypothetical protein Q5P01_001079 [Channa striata]|uniref:Uncharacterized protein n=1 Tax=Channa striata TaxID=64152 RepID=A0AA88NK14_CHASR|nr:hypothetical protein Q5P01_001079 [Channa striata]
MKARESDRRKEGRDGERGGTCRLWRPPLPPLLCVGLRNKSHFLRLLCLRRGDALLCVRETRRQADRQEDVQKCTQPRGSGEHATAPPHNAAVIPAGSSQTGYLQDSQA